jgi:beta-lactamase superfamily II metal-dependent hydrolase
VIYPSLQREGQASVAIDEKKKAAYVVDLGRGGDGDQIKIDNVPILDKLSGLGIEDLFFVCSHPHSDHMGGIRALFKNPGVFFRDKEWTNPKFKSISVIDDGVPNGLYPLLKQAMGGNTLIRTNYLSASGRNAFAGISSKADDVNIETIPYQIAAKPGVHGRAVVTLIKLGDTVILDPDDADSNVIAKVAETLKGRGVNRITVFVVPHHGSKYHDIEPLLSLRPRYAVIAVNPENRYGHPSPSILRKLMEQLGNDNVIFTGSVGDVVFDSKGVRSVEFTAADKDSYALFVAQNRVRAESRGNKEDLGDLAIIEKMMMGEDVKGPSITTPQRGGAGKLFEADIRANGSILPADFELGAVSYGNDGPNTLQNHKVFASNLSATNDLTGMSVAVRIERDSDAPESRTGLTKAEAQGILQQLRMLGTNADKAKEIVVSFSSPIGSLDVLQPDLVTSEDELSRLLTRPRVTGSRPTRRVPGTTFKPPLNPAEPIPRGGMVFLRGNKLFPVGEASELLGGNLQVCGTRYCVIGAGGTSYELPFSPGRLFSEIWTRVYDRRIDSFYLSINPTKEFLHNFNRGLRQVPSDKLKYGGGVTGVGLRTHEVVTAGDIENSEIGRILWESDVAFKSASLGFNVLTGRASPFVDAVAGRVSEDSPGTGATVPYQQRWCRLYWTSGEQRFEVDKGSNAIRFAGDAVIARSEAMKMQAGDLVDEPRGRWCGESKRVAAYLQQAANSGRTTLAVLSQLRELAEIQNFVRWARDNGLTCTGACRDSLAPQRVASDYQVPDWTSGIQTEPRVWVQLQRGFAGRKLVEFVHVNFAEIAGSVRCIDPYWNAHVSDFPANGLRFDEIKGEWVIPPDKYPFIDSWMNDLARKIADCSGGYLRPMIGGARKLQSSGGGEGGAEIGIIPHTQSIHMHGGVLLGVKQGFLEAARDRGLLLSPTRKPLFQRDGSNLHFWNFVETKNGAVSVGQHLSISDAVVKRAYADSGYLFFEVETKDGSIVRSEARVGHKDDFMKGGEWVAAWHGSDGSLIWNKAALPCADPQPSKGGCVKIVDSSLTAFIKNRGDENLTILHQAQNSWLVAIDITSLRSELDHNWQKIPQSDMNSRLSLVYEYAKWGFFEEAKKRYQELAEKIEKDTVDTILLRQLEAPSKQN